MLNANIGDMIALDRENPEQIVRVMDVLPDGQYAVLFPDGHQELLKPGPNAIVVSKASGF